MNTFPLSMALGGLLIISAIFNGIQYSHTKTTQGKLTFFESHFGTYESVSEMSKQSDQMKDKKDRTVFVYIKKEVSESQILALKSVLEKQTVIQSMQYTSAEQALADFKAKHQNDELTMQALNELGTNPLGAIFTLSITDPSQKQLLVTAIESNDPNLIVDRINY